MTDEELRKLLASNPDIAIAGATGRADSTKAPKTDKHTAQSGSVLESRFGALWEIAGCPPLVREYRFDEVRRWRFDFAHPATQIAIEIEGGLYGNGRHQRAQGYIADCEKYNVATLGGWQVYRLTSEMITAEWCNRIADAIRTTEVLRK